MTHTTDQDSGRDTGEAFVADQERYTSPEVTWGDVEDTLQAAQDLIFERMGSLPEGAVIAFNEAPENQPERWVKGTKPGVFPPVGVDYPGVKDSFIFAKKGRRLQVSYGVVALTTGSSGYGTGDTVSLDTVGDRVRFQLTGPAIPGSQFPISHVMGTEGSPKTQRQKRGSGWEPVRDEGAMDPAQALKFVEARYDEIDEALERAAELSTTN